MPIVNSPESYEQVLSCTGDRNIFNVTESGKVEFSTASGKVEAETRFIGHPENPSIGANQLNDIGLSPVLLWWYKANLPASESLTQYTNFEHQSMVTYHSDYQLIFTSLLPHSSIGNRSREELLSMMVSLDHSVWFHDTVYGDEWLLYRMESHRASYGRVLLIGKLFNMSGKLVVSVVQEGYLKQSNSYLSKKDPKTIYVNYPKIN
ncbi:Acyl-coenzyme A thioesterase 8 [Smittium culicis]|uniref:Acyl-coenzyme A thioesterase 8 n=1 Tax=Smittium culicis TaxID=133412 RepID=A0A1R1WYJ3_9FUNG|nr:Acyl-coenzyme A thioesterase 8 [Smittium culicis]